MPADRAITMEELLDALGLTAQVLEQHQVRYAVIGGMAAGFRAQARFTKDIDFLLQVPQITLPGLLDSLQERGFQFDQRDTIRAWVDHHMVVMSYRGIRIDWLKPIVSAYQQVLERATEESWLGRRIFVASAEGLILLKLIAGRPQDWVDIGNLVAAADGKVDLDWIRTQWQTVGDLADPPMTRLTELVEGDS